MSKLLDVTLYSVLKGAQYPMQLRDHRGRYYICDDDGLHVVQYDGSLGLLITGAIQDFAFKGDRLFLLEGSPATLTSYRFEYNVVVPNSRRIILETGGHGCIQFGPDGMLYLGISSQSSREGSNQDRSFLGKVLRIDVRSDTHRPYISPVDNPYYKIIGTRPETFVKGIELPEDLVFAKSKGASLIFVIDGVKLYLLPSSGKIEMKLPGVDGITGACFLSKFLVVTTTDGYLKYFDYSNNLIKSVLVSGKLRGMIQDSHFNMFILIQNGDVHEILSVVHVLN
jgi:hypothetical protein